MVFAPADRGCGCEGHLPIPDAQDLIGVSRDIEYDLRNDLFQHLESLATDYYQRTRTGDIIGAHTTNA